MVERFDPGRNASLACIYLLTSSHKTNDNCPVFPLVERPDEEFGFREREVWHFQFVAVRTSSFQIISNSFMCPAALRFVEDGNMLYLAIARRCHFHGFLRVNLHPTILHGVLDFCEHIVTVSMDNLYELANLSARIRQAFPLSSILLVIVTSQGFCENRHKRTITREINGTIFLRTILFLICLFDGYIKSHECLACSRNSRHEANTFLAIAFALVNYPQQIINSGIRADLVCLMAGNVFHRVTLVKRACGFDDSRCGCIWADNPVVDRC